MDEDADLDSLVVDNTLLCDMVCDTKAALRHVLGLTTKEESAALKCGQCVHHAMAAYFLTGDAEVAIRVFDRTYKPWADAEVDPNDRLAHHNTRRCIESWIKDHSIKRLPFSMKKKWVEQPIKIELGKIGKVQVQFAMIMDGVAMMKKSEGLYIVDHKSTGRINQWWKDRQRYTSQFTGYIQGAEAYTGKTITGVIVNGIALPQLNTSSSKCPKHKVPYAECATAPEHLSHEIMVVTRNEDQIRSWRDAALHLANEYRDLRDAITRIQDVQHCLQQGTFYGHCAWCEFKGFCDRGRTPHAAKLLLKQDRWDPMVHGEQRRAIARKIEEKYGNGGEDGEEK